MAVERLFDIELLEARLLLSSDGLVLVGAQLTPSDVSSEVAFEAQPTNAFSEGLIYDPPDSLDDLFGESETILGPNSDSNSENTPGADGAEDNPALAASAIEQTQETSANPQGPLQTNAETAAVVLEDQFLNPTS